MASIMPNEPPLSVDTNSNDWRTICTKINRMVEKHTNILRSAGDLHSVGRAQGAIQALEELRSSFMKEARMQELRQPLRHPSNPT